MRNKSIITKVILLVLQLSIFSSFSFGQSEFNLIPPSPNAANLGKYGEIPLNLSTGAPNLSIPLYEINEGDIKWPISLNYNYNGYKPSEISGWVGRGWSLIGGGVVTRTIRGLRDESINVGYLTKGAEVESAINTYLMPGGNATLISGIYTNLQAGNYDSEPDIFYFNFGNYSGKFFFGPDGLAHLMPNQDIKIEKVVQNYLSEGTHEINGIIMSFKITTEDGTEYIFDVREYSLTHATYVTENGPSAWHLRSMTTPNGSRLLFNYSTLGATRVYSPVLVEQGVGPACPANNFGECLSSGSSSTSIKKELNFNVSEERFLNSITVENGFATVNFNTSIISLDNANIPNISNSSRRLNSIEVRNNNNNTFIEKKLLNYNGTLLASVIPQNASGINESGYSMTYDSPFFLQNEPMISESNQTDYWGYLNSYSSNNYFVSMIPELGANRTPDFNFAKRGSLVEFKYPTGGKSVLEYEPNTYTYESDGISNNQQIVIEEHTFNYLGWATPTISNTTIITVDYPSQYSVKYNCIHSPYNPPSSGCPIGTCSFEGLVVTGTLMPNVQYNSSNFITNALLSGQQCINELSIAAHLTIQRVTQLNQSYGPGIRIKKIETSAFINEITSKEYTYQAINGIPGGLLIVPGGSTGFIKRKPSFLELVTFNLLPSSTVVYYTFKNSSILNIGAPSVIYGQVQEVVNGTYKNQYHYSSYFGDYKDINNALIPGYDDYNNVGNDDSFDFARGSLLLENNFIGLNTLSKQIEKQYTFRHTLNTNLKNIEEYRAPSIYFESLVSVNHSGMNQKICFMKIYNTSSIKFKETKQITRDFDISTVIESTENKLYESTIHLQQTKSRITKNNGEIIEKNYKYPKDYLVVPGRASFIDGLISSNIIGVPLEQTTILEKSVNDRKVIDASVTTFKSFTGNTNKPSLILPFKKYTFNGYTSGTNFPLFDGLTDEINTTNYREVLKFENYNTQGSPTGILKNQSVKVSYLWSCLGKYPIAEVNNLSWPQLNSALGVISTSESQMLNSVDNVFIESKLNSLRTSPVTNGNLINTYLYQPMTGLIKKVSPNGLSQSYSYDSFNRLAEIKDHNSKVVKKYQYYFGQN